MRSAPNIHTDQSRLQQLQQWITSVEGEHFEFKEAKNRFSFDELGKYCCALANEGGGKVILGVTDKRPRRIVGTRAFHQPECARRSLMEKIHLRIDVLEITHPEGRVLVFDVPSRPIGTAIKYGGVYWSRKTDSLVPMDEDQLRVVFEEIGHDFSADVCAGASLSDLDPTAIEDFRRRWIDKSSNKRLATLSHEQLLRDAELIVDDGVTFAALILLGKRQAMSRFLAQAEVIFEYRSSDAAGPAQQRKEFRQGFFGYYDDLWRTINLRNDLQHYQDGLFVLDIPTFDERSVREAVLNAVSHRDYRLGGSVFIRQYPQRIEIVSPGGFPLGITVENVLWQQNPRNRRIAEALGKCGLVERSGQGFDLIYQECIRHSKPLPDLSRTDAYSVWLTFHGKIQDPEFLRFLEQIGQERMSSFSTEDFLVIDLIRRGETVPDNLQGRIHNLVDNGVIERVGKGRSVKYLLSRRFYRFIGKPGVYTRKRGLDRETNKALLLKHIRECGTEGTTLGELQDVLPSLSLSSIQWMLRQLKKEGDVKVVGRTRAARWFST